MGMKILWYWGFVGACLTVCGCGPEQPKTVGFLSDYSHLRPETKLRSRYCPPDNHLGQYSQFIVDSVPVYLDDQTRMKLPRDTNLAELSQYLHDTMVTTLEPRYPVAGVTPGPGTGRIRMALTYLRKGEPFNPGAAALECEVVDSQTGVQLGALREIQKGKGSRSEWGDVKGVMDDWAREFYAVLEEQHGRGPRPQAVFTPPPQALGK